MSDYLSANGEWNIDRLRNALPQDLCNVISKYRVNVEDGMKDFLV